MKYKNTIGWFLLALLNYALAIYGLIIDDQLAIYIGLLFAALGGGGALQLYQAYINLPIPKRKH